MFSRTARPSFPVANSELDDDGTWDSICRSCFLTVATEKYEKDLTRREKTLYRYIPATEDDTQMLTGLRETFAHGEPCNRPEVERKSRTDKMFGVT